MRELLLTFIDNVTRKSKNPGKHLNTDLPKAFAICSRYNILLKPSKCNLLISKVCVLGCRVSRSMESLTEEKKEKNLKYDIPNNEVGCRIKSSVLLLLPVTHRLSELMAPLCRLRVVVVLVAVPVTLVAEWRLQ